MNIVYKNRNNEVLNLIQKPFLMLTDTSLFDYKWKYNTDINNNVSEFYSEQKEITIKIAVFGSTEEEYLTNCKHLTEFFDADVRFKSPGKLFFDDYYLQGYIVESTKPRKYLKKQFTIVEFKFVSASLNWVKPTKIEFESEEEESDYLDYPYDFSYDFKKSSMASSFNYSGYAPCDYELVIYGPCTNPVISIDDWNYGIDEALNTREKVVINSKTQKIYRVNADGTTDNLFYARLRDFDFTEKIKPGLNAVSLNGYFKFDLTLFENRSEPKLI